MNDKRGISTNPITDDSETGCSDTSCCPPNTPITRDAPKVGRNDPCICGNGRKFKKCCGKNL
ncbi:MAG: SEC-C metal-binding domain-containing protein [Porticoccaceae bacterium]|nr:SEC-C metal-binding domain-containing protein [Porticoccaceae bacterium]